MFCAACERRFHTKRTHTFNGFLMDMKMQIYMPWTMHEHVCVCEARRFIAGRSSPTNGVSPLCPGILRIEVNYGYRKHQARIIHFYSGWCQADRHILWPWCVNRIYMLTNLYVESDPCELCYWWPAQIPDTTHAIIMRRINTKRTNYTHYIHIRPAQHVHSIQPYTCITCMPFVRMKKWKYPPNISSYAFCYAYISILSLRAFHRYGNKIFVIYWYECVSLWIRFDAVALIVRIWVGRIMFRTRHLWLCRLCRFHFHRKMDIRSGWASKSYLCFVRDNRGPEELEKETK